MQDRPPRLADESLDDFHWRAAALRGAFIGLGVGATVPLTLWAGTIIPTATLAITVPVSALIGIFIGAWSGGIIGLDVPTKRLRRRRHLLSGENVIIEIYGEPTLPRSEVAPMARLLRRAGATSIRLEEGLAA